MDRANGDPVWMRIGGVYKEYGRNEYVQKNAKLVRTWRLVGIPGFEPGMTGPESVVLPLHHIPMFLQSEFVFPCLRVQRYCFFLNYQRKIQDFL